LDEVEPSGIAVEILGAAAEASQEALDLAVTAVDGLSVQGSANPLSGTGSDALVLPTLAGETAASLPGIGLEAAAGQWPGRHDRRGALP